MAKGSLVDWDTAEFVLENMVEVDLEPAAMCTPLRPGHVIFPRPRNISAARDVCRKMRANMTVVHDRKTQTELNDIYRESPFVEWTGRELEKRVQFWNLDAFLLLENAAVPTHTSSIVG